MIAYKQLILYMSINRNMITCFITFLSGGGRAVKGDRLRAYWVSPFAGSSPVPRIHKLFLIL